METRANKDRVNRFCAKLPHCWKWAPILADIFSGRIIVIWNSSIGLVSPIAVSRRALHLIISFDSSGSWIIFVVYNFSRLWSQCSLWIELSKISSLSIPWLLVGDFNSIVTCMEHKGGSFKYYSRKASFFF